MNIKQAKDPLISLLAEMPGVAESDFRVQVMARVQARRLRRKAAFLTAWCCAIVAIFLSLPLERILAPLMSLTKTTQVLWSEIATFEQTPTLTQWQLQMGGNNLLIVLITAALVILIASTALLQD